MDPHTLELLEFGKVRELLAGYCATSLGKEQARKVEPDTDADSIRARIGLVSEMVDTLGQGQAPPFAGVHDVRLLIRRAAIGSMLTAEQLLEVADTLTATGAIYRYRMRLSEHCQKLMAFLAPIEDLGAAAKMVTGCIDGRGHVLDMASPELGQVRHRLADLDERVQHQIKRLLRDPELRRILRYPNATVSGDHYVLPVAVNFRHKLPGVVHRTSSTGETLFIEPAGVASLSASRAVLKSDEEREIRRVLRRLSADVGRLAHPLTRAIDVLAELDVITAKARYSRDYHMMPPDINAEGKLWLRQARHPLLQYLFRQEAGKGTEGPRDREIEGQRDRGIEGRRESGIEGSSPGLSVPPSLRPSVSPSGSTPEREVSPQREVVPVDVRLGHAFNMLVITGPNTGGKTVSLKTTGLLCLMAQSGMHIPAGEGSQVPVFGQVLADIGDEQSLEQSLSTFSSHISRIAGILRTADAQSLVLLDELGSGTDPTEGAALGRAILDSLDQIGCRAMVTTHLGDLKTYAFANERAENAAVEFDVETLRPTYRLQIGQFGASNALQIARRLKLPRDLLKRAHRYLRRKQRRAPELARLQELREEAEKARADALAAQHDATKKRDEYVQQAEKLQREAEAAARLRDWRAKLQAGDAVYVERFGKPGKVVRVDHKKGVVVVSVGLGQWEVPLEEVLPVER